MTKQIDELMRLATALPAASCGSNANYIQAAETLRSALEAALEAIERYQVKRQDFDRFAD
jgi:hypothetical protein